MTALDEIKIPLFEEKIHRSVNLPNRLWSFAKKKGKGSYAKGVRILLEEAFNHEENESG